MKDYIENIKGSERRFSSNLPELRSEGDSRKVRGLGIVYNSLSENFAPWMPGGLYEIIEPESTRGLLEDEDTMILFNHDPNFVLARNKNTASLIDSPEGVYYEFEAPDTTAGNDLRMNLQLKNVRKSSFAFIPKEIKREKRDWEGLGNINIRRITKFERMIDFSPVVYPAYNATEVMARGYQSEIEKEVNEQNSRERKMREIQHGLRMMKLKF